jgi:hypothetical protein
MIECPECGEPMKGRKCSCGYFIKGRVLSDEEKHALDSSKAIADDVHLQSCRQWLLDRRIVTADMTNPERQKAMAAYRAKLATMHRPAPRDWAGILLSKEADGEILPTIAGKMAHGVMDMETEE